MMMMIRLCASDMDGTLLNEEHVLSEKTLDVVKSLRERGVLVALCSGRSTPSIREHAERLKTTVTCGGEKSIVSPPIVAYNGAVVRLGSGETVFTSRVPEAAVDAVLSFAEREACMCQYYIDEKIYCVCTTAAHREFARAYQELTRVYDAHIFTDSYAEARALGLPYKLLMMTPSAEIDARMERLRAALPENSAHVIRGT